MEDHPLLRAVAKWPGRGPTQRAFEALGFTIHRESQNEIIQFCGEQQSQLINRYWDEIALETMQCLGQCNPDQRWFTIQPAYRSSFLDELFAARAPIEEPYRNPPLVKCLLEHIKKCSSDREFNAKRIALFSARKQAEADRLGIDAKEGLKKKTDVIPILEHFCGAAGFDGRSRNRWRKRIGSGLVFEIGVWMGGNALRMWGRLKFHIHHVDEPKYALDVEGAAALLNRLVPGMYIYEGCSSDRDYVLSVRAQIELFNVIAGAFEEAAARS